MDFLMESLRPLSPSLGYVIIRVAEVATSLWTWTALISISFFSLWRFRGIRRFHFCFLWWGKNAHLRIMLQSFSASNNNSAGKNSTAFANDNRRLCRNMCMDDFHVFRYAGESLMERGIYTRSSRKRNKSSSTIDSLTLCNSLEAMDNCTEANSACFLETKMMFIVEKSSSFSASRSVSLPSPLRFGKMGLESLNAESQQLDYQSPTLIRLPMHDKHCPADKYEEKDCRSGEKPMQKSKGKITFSSDFLYNVEKCRGGSLFMNDVEGARPLGPCLLVNCVGLLLWRRLGSFETQFGWDRLQSLRLGYDWNWNWNYCTGWSGLNFDKFSKYLVPDIHVTKALDSPKRSAVKLFSLQEDAVSSIDMVWNMGLSFTSTIDNTVCIWDIEVGKCLNKIMISDYPIVGSHIENSSGFLLNSIMIRDVEASILVWDGRDFHRPLNFCVGNMLRFHSVQFNDNKFSVSDCYNDRLFDLRMMAGSSSDSSVRSKAVFSYE